MRDDYGLRPFVREVADDIAGRCVKCYEMRLFEAARAAKEGGFDAFTSSLFISPYQKHELMRDVAYLAAEENGVTFYYQDFRPMFRDGQARARELGFYMQKYCGCVFSEEDSFLDRKKGLVPIQKYNNRKEEDAGHKTGGGKDDGDQDSRKEKSL